MQNKKIIITGAGGFIAGHLIKSLKEKGFSHIRGVDIKPFGEWFQLDPDVENIQGDMFEPKDCMKAVKGMDYVYNFCEEFGGIGFIETYKAICGASVSLNANMLRAAANEGIERYAFSSSACVYSAEKQKDNYGKALKEEDVFPHGPEKGYGESKRLNELLCGYFLDDFGIETRIPRFHNVYGTYSSIDGGREKAPAAMCRKVIEAKLSGKNEIEIWGDGTATRSFMYIDDCVKGVQLIMNGDYPEPINLGSSELVTINELVTIVEEIAGVKLKRKYLLDAPKGVNGRNSDNTLIKSLYNWEPEIKLRDGLEKTYRWIFDQIKAANS